MRQRQFAAPPLRTSDSHSPRVDEALLAKVIAINPQVAARPELAQAKRPCTPAAAPVLLPETELEAALACFMRGQQAAIGDKLRTLVAEQRRIEAEITGLKQQARVGVQAFLRVMDAHVVSRHGQNVLAKHDRYLNQIDTNAEQLLR